MVKDSSFAQFPVFLIILAYIVPDWQLCANAILTRYDQKEIDKQIRTATKSTFILREKMKKKTHHACIIVPMS